MSRIDEALARAGSRPAEPVRPVTSPPDVDGAFASEPDVTPDDAAREPEVHQPASLGGGVAADLPLTAD
ncbi:MAG: hypothetical protein ABIX28_04135, partial [Vicinamibacterales bacterium]